MNYNTRNDFGKLFEEHYLIGKGAEIGVQNGWFSKQIFEGWKGMIYGVDRWEHPEELKTTCINLRGKYFLPFVGESVEVAQLFDNESLDFVYIDAGHTYEDIQADFYAWLPKVRTGGIVSGHDYGDNGFGVKKFIDELIAEGYQINFTTDDFWEGIEYQSWWFIKV